MGDNTPPSYVRHIQDNLPDAFVHLWFPRLFSPADNRSMFAELCAVKTAVEAKDWMKLRVLAHRVKGSSRTAGLPVLAAAWERLQKVEDVTTAREAACDVLKAIEATRKELIETGLIPSLSDAPVRHSVLR